MGLDQKLMQLRREKGLSQLALAEQLNVSRQAVSKWESGRSLPSTENLIYLSHLYAVSMEYLVHETQERQAAVQTIAAENMQAQKKQSVSLGAWLKNATIAALIVTIGILLYISMTKEEGGEDAEIMPIENMQAEEVYINPDATFQLEW